MISERAQQSFDQMVTRAILASPLVEVDVRRGVECSPVLARVQTTHMVVLTVSSYLFRLNFMLHYADDSVTRAHFAAANKVNPEDLGEQAFLDAIRECGNICCGNLNRDLVSVFPHVGMSTPNIVDRHCVAHLAKLAPGYVQHYELVDAGGPPFAVTLCIKEFADLDFAVQLDQVEETGELEMF